MVSGSLPSAGTGVNGKLCRVELDGFNVASWIRRWIERNRDAEAGIPEGDET